MNDVMGVVNLIGFNYSLDELTQHRPLGTVPFASRYRLIDFALSGLINSGIDTVGILLPWQQRSVVDHVRSGKDWLSSPKREGLTLLLPPDERQPTELHEAASLLVNREFFAKSNRNLVLLLPGGVVGNFDFRGAIRSHRRTAADATLLYKQETTACSCGNHIALDLTSNGSIRQVVFCPPEAQKSNYFWGPMLLSKQRLYELADECIEQNIGSLTEAIARKLGQWKIRAYHYPGYLSRIHCVESYHSAMMQMLEQAAWQQVFQEPGHIYSKIRNDRPSQYGEQAVVSRTMTGGGCVIQGSVDHSILFRRVRICQGAVVKHSILMSNAMVEEQAFLEHVICDKDVKITAGQVLRGTSARPLVLKKGSVI